MNWTLVFTGTTGLYPLVYTGGSTQMGCITLAWIYQYTYSVLVSILSGGNGVKGKDNNMATCRECGAEHIVQYYCELCGNYGCRECSDHCSGCTNRMEEVEDEQRNE